ncbi:alpha/beta hydrolase fold protein [Purpureocillium lavendulum]|uniref:Alpha/beta hydrolase fold protein n=1 Tax=Purpureocillium lavendulum TaxID=1247861 RepID=A0AB34FZP7_9HYPO|nr:alpha/beta hydrolase fold protein [Purpureocillium lavendulum]
MAQQPSTPVKVPSSAANYTPATLDPDLRSQINTVLLRDGHVAKIQEALLHALNAHASNWPTAVQNHALSLLRSGEETTYPALLRRVLDDVRADSASSSSSSSAPSTAKNGSKTPNGDAKKVNGAAADAAGDKPNLALPDTVLQEALRVTRESLEAVCDVDEAGS